MGSIQQNEIDTLKSNLSSNEFDRVLDMYEKIHSVDTSLAEKIIISNSLVDFLQYLRRKNNNFTKI